MNAKEIARETIEAARDDLVALSHRIYENPELRFKEHQASEWLAEYLVVNGFTVTKPYCELDTAFAARVGSGALHIAICAEYDALPEVGHACGHNIIATSALGAGLGLARVADELGLTVTVLGTPAEEGGGGKILMLERGGFDGVHAAMMVHPSPVDVAEPNVIASQRVDVRYIGKAAHASSFPERGINALDAMTVAQVAIGLLRQHIRNTDRIHGIVTHGGDASNVIPERTEALYAIRARTIAELDSIREKVRRCFEAGAIATGTTLDFRTNEHPYSELKSDSDIASHYRDNAEAIGRIFPELNPRAASAAGSTDMGNVSLRIPSIHPMIGINSLPAVNHQAEFAKHSITPAGDRAVTDGAIAMAWTAIDCALDIPLRERLLSA